MAQTLEFSTQFSNHIPEDDQTTTWKDCSNSVSRPSPVASQHASASKMHSSIVEDGPLRFRDELPNDLTEDVSADPIVITPTFGSISASPAWRWFNKYLFIISLLLGIAICRFSVALSPQFCWLNLFFCSCLRRGCPSTILLFPRQ